MHLCLTKHLKSISSKAILWDKGVFNDFFVNMYMKLSIYGAVFYSVLRVASRRIRSRLSSSF
jgi:hypothetical protein